MKKQLAAVVITLQAFSATGTFAQNAEIEAPKPYPLKTEIGGETTDFVPMDSISKPWNICILFPHLKDSLWVAFNYGIMTELERLGAKATLFSAGSYNDLPKQVSQFENCLTGGFDAVLVGAISEAGLSGQIQRAKELGIPVIGFGNPITTAPITTQIMTPPEEFGQAGGNYLKKLLGGKAATAVLFPGPQGAGWAEGHDAGFRAAVADTSIEVLAAQYGEPSVAAQLTLVENAIQTYGVVDVIWGTAPTIEAAVGVMADLSNTDTMLVSSYQNLASKDLLGKGQIQAFAVQFTTTEGWIAADLALMALEGQEVAPIYVDSPKAFDAETFGNLDLTTVFPPEGYKPVFSLE